MKNYVSFLKNNSNSQKEKIFSLGKLYLIFKELHDKYKSNKDILEKVTKYKLFTYSGPFGTFIFMLTTNKKPDLYLGKLKIHVLIIFIDSFYD